MKIFVAHYAKLTERKEHMLNEFKRNGITDYEFIETEFDKGDLVFENLSYSQISLILKHLHIYKKIPEDGALILEDDVLLRKDFVKTLNSYMEQISGIDYDMIFLGDGCNLHIQKNKLIPGKNMYEKSVYPTLWARDGAIRCTDSYIISKKCADKIHPDIEMCLPIDWWLSEVCRRNKFKVFWAEPTIVTQGSQNGIFESTHKWDDN